MNDQEVRRALAALGEVIHDGAHALAVRFDDGLVLVALATAHGDDTWLELRLWVAARSAAPVEALLARNARLAYGAFCAVDGELYLRAAIARAHLTPPVLARIVAGLRAEAALVDELAREQSAIHAAFGHLA